MVGIASPGGGTAFGPPSPAPPSTYFDKTADHVQQNRKPKEDLGSGWKLGADEAILGLPKSLATIAVKYSKVAGLLEIGIVRSPV